MAQDKVTRRLAAIFAADMVGYSRLMEADEEGTIARQKAHRKELIDPKITEYEGRIVKLMGDGMLVEFASVVDAVRCAVEVQQAMQEREADVPEERRIVYRVGVNLGDIVIEDDDVMGDGVNVAARLEALAKPGEVLISGTAFDHLKKKLEYGYHFRGERKVKNIADPVRMYGVLPDSDAGTVLGRQRLSPTTWRWVAGAAAVLLLVVAGMAWWQPWVLRVEPARLAEMAFPLPAKPSIVVLPFENLTGDEAQGYLADGLTENIISTLATMPELFVIARNSSFTYQGKAVQVKTVAEDLGVRFVLEGSVQLSGDTLRVTAQLIDAVGGFHIWTKSYDRQLTSLFALQDEISEQIAAALEVKLTEGEQARLRRKSTSLPEAYQLYLQGKANFRLFTQRDMKRAESLFEQALGVDPKFVAAIVELAHVHYVYGRLRWSEDPDASFAKAEALVQQALAIDADYPEGFTSLGRIERSWHQNHNKALTYHREAVALAPNCAECLRELANELQYIGDGKQAIPIFKQAMRLEPNYSILYLQGLARSYNLTGEYPKSLQASDEMIKRWPNSYWGYLQAAITHGMAGQADEARRYVKETLRLRPDLRASRHAELTPYKGRARATREAEILRKAGMPD